MSSQEAVLSKPSAARGVVRALYVVPLIGTIFIALLVFVSSEHWRSTGKQASISSRPQLHEPSVSERERIQGIYGTLPLVFEQNAGQTDPAVKYMARANGYTLFLTPTDAVFSLHSSSSKAGEPPLSGRALGKGASPTEKNSRAVVHMRFVGANAPEKIAASGDLPGKANYFLGNDPSKWQRNVPLYDCVSYHNVYPGVDLAFHGKQRQLEFDFVVAPGANANTIAFQLSGAETIKTDDGGNLVVSSSAGSVLLEKPFAYQELNGRREPVNASFALSADQRVNFTLGKYDHRRELVIDPSVAVVFSSYLGGTGEDDGLAIAVDNADDAYVTGKTESPNFPIVGGLGPGYDADFDAFITKIASGGSSLIYSTYVGGSADDSGNAIAVDANGDAFVAGGTSSTDFPHSSGAFQEVQQGTTNAFILELNPAGSALTYSTYLGGSGNDLAYGIAVGSSGNAYVTGQATSPNFPVLPLSNPLQNYPGTTDNGFVTELNSTGTALVYSTYLNLGGTIGDSANAIALDASGNAYVTGTTSSSSFHTTSGALQTGCGTDGNCNGTSDAFVTVINSEGTGYVYSTFLGGSGADTGLSIAVDASGSAYVTGSTESGTDFPLKSPLQPTFGGSTDAFVTKLNPAGSALVYSTYLGGTSFDEGGSIRVDSGGNAYVAGWTDSQPPSPFTGPNATQATLGGGSDAFVSEINAAGSKLLFSTYLGGPGNEDSSSTAGALAVDAFGSILYVTGNTTGSFPVQLPFPYAGGGSYGGNIDAFVAEYAQPSYSIAATTPAAVAPGSSGTSTVTLTALNAYASPVNLACAVSGSGSPLPACSASSFSTNPTTPTTGNGATTTLTITTTGSSGEALRERKHYYALWLGISGLGIVGTVFAIFPCSRANTLLGLLMISVIIGGLLLMPACGSSGGGGGGGGGGGAGAGGGGGGGGSGTATPAGTYTVTITGTGTDSNATTESISIPLTVN